MQRIDISSFLAAVESGNADVVRDFLIKNHEDKGAHYSVALITAATHGYTEIVQLLLEDGRADPTAQLSLALRNACKERHGDVVQLLLNDNRDKPANPEAFNNYAIQHASENGHADIVALLLESEKIGKAGRNRALITACTNGHVNVVKLFLEGFIHYTFPSNPIDLINYAFANGHSAVVELILSKFGQDHLLYLACESGELSVVKFLLKKGADPKPRGYGCSAIEVAAKNGHVEVVAFLLKVKDSRINPNSAMKAAATYGHAIIVKLVLSDNRIVSSDITKSFILACENDHVKVAAEFLNVDAFDPLNQADQFVFSNGFTGAISNGSFGMLSSLLTCDFVKKMDMIEYNKMIGWGVMTASFRNRPDVVDYILTYLTESSNLIFVLNQSRKNKQVFAKVCSHLFFKQVSTIFSAYQQDHGHGRILTSRPQETISSAKQQTTQTTTQISHKRK